MEGRQRGQHPLPAWAPSTWTAATSIPLHKSVRDALDASQVVSFELDLNDQEGMALLAQLQAYSDGTTLADHISPELYARVQAAAVSLGMEPNGFDAYKPWALASTFGVLSLQDDTTGANAMAIDVYINAYAVNAGKTIDSVETCAFRAASSTACPPSTREAYPGRQPTGRSTRGCSNALAGRRRPTRRPRRWPGGPAGADCRHVRCLEEPGPRCPGGGLRQGGGYP
ncbi:MAG: TraB/GumN family protein [Flavonifractor plautii]